MQICLSLDATSIFSKKNSAERCNLSTVSPLSGTCPKKPHYEVSRRHFSQMPKPLKLAPFNAKYRLLSSVPLPNSSPYDHSHPTCILSLSFSPYPTACNNKRGGGGRKSTFKLCSIYITGLYSILITGVLQKY